MAKPAKRNTRRSSTTSAASRALPPPTPSEAAFERLLAHFDDLDDTHVEPTLLTHGEAARGDTQVESVLGDPDVRSALHDETRDRLKLPIELDLAAESAAHDSAAPAGAAAFLDGLFAKKDAYLERDRFATIGEADDFYTKVVGVSFEGRQDVVGGLTPGDRLELVREPQNTFDVNAVAVRYGALALGFVRREIARHIALNIDAGERYEATVGSLTGGGERHLGVNIHVRRHRALRPSAAPTARDARSSVVTVDDVRVAFIGARPLRDAQRAVLDRVAAGRNTLAVMGTGRGKSLCFTLPAAERALERHEKTLVFYPLRALANDQYDALSRRLEPMGLRVLRANGSIDGNERAALDDALETGAWDVILATPEFVSYHRAAFVRPCNRPQLIVVDEAHHIFESKHRAAYGSLGTLVSDLGSPQVLGLTATANDAAFRDIRQALGIDAWVIDPTVRENLCVVDARNRSDKNAYLARELEGNGKAIVYCNSRAEATKLAERLRARFGSVSFYHAGIPNQERAGIEDLFRSGGLRVIVATSAFGEGIDLPDVRDVVLYHLNFDFTGFNQMAGRAGRDGAPARIHLLYGDGDRRINDFILERNAPTLASLREIYRGMRGLARDGMLRTSFEEVARTLTIEAVDGGSIGSAVRIFAEGGLVEAGVDDDGRFVRFLDVPGKVDLTATARFAEGLAEREAFERFCDLALGADAATLEQVINRPIYPDRIALTAP